MTASRARRARPDRRTRGALRAGLLAGLAPLWACATPAPLPTGSALQPLPSVGARVPDEADLLARDLAAAALAEPRRAQRAELEKLEAIEAARTREGLAPTGLVPVAQDLVNAALDDPIAYRRATGQVLERDDLADTLRKRLEAEVEDDPLRLADRRLHDAFVEDTAQVFNAVVAPLSRAAFTPILAGVGLAQSLTGLALAKRMEDPLEFRERQALAHWKRFLDEHPDAPEAPEIARRTEATQVRWNETRRDRALRAARQALRRENWAGALLLAQRAERYWPEDPDALEIMARAADRLEARQEREAASLRADPEAAHGADALPAARELALALLAPDADLAATARGVLEADPDGPLADEARFALAIAARERGDAEDEERSWEILREVADTRMDRSTMARHARALVDSPVANPYAAFRRGRSSARWDRVRWVLFGPYAKGPRRRDLPRPLEWLVDLPSLAQTLTTFPTRLVQSPWTDGSRFGRKAAVAAERYLERWPDGAHAQEVSSWLQDWHGGKGDWIGAYELARRSEDGSSIHLARLRRLAAEQALKGARRQTRTDLRLAMLRHVAREFHGTRPAEQAAEDARRELEHATTQRIRISRGFLLENPRVAGPDGLALRPELLDGDIGNGELHPDGVILAGGRVLEFHYVGESGRMRGEPAIRRQRVSPTRLARLVAILDETASDNFLRDPGEVLGADADRDLFFDRARLGLTDEPDARAGARSTYAFIGMKERYGLVRSREPILPFDIVFQGSLPDLGFSVFPRMRAPRATPDAILYQ